MNNKDKLKICNSFKNCQCYNGAIFNCNYEKWVNYANKKRSISEKFYPEIPEIEVIIIDYMLISKSFLEKYIKKTLDMKSQNKI